jgi:hypothetical protein
VKFTEAQLPSNRKFGIFFTSIFLILSFYFFWKDLPQVSVLSFILAILFALTTLIKDNLLSPINILWMRFGFLLGSIISPIVLGIFFFIIFTPLGILLRFLGRDELRLKLSNRASFWRLKDHNIEYHSDSFKNQF